MTLNKTIVPVANTYNVDPASGKTTLRTTVLTAGTPWRISFSEDNSPRNSTTSDTSSKATSCSIPPSAASTRPSTGITVESVTGAVLTLNKYFPVTGKPARFHYCPRTESYNSVGLACVSGWQTQGFSAKQTNFLEEWFKLTKFVSDDEAEEIKTALDFDNCAEIKEWFKNKRVRSSLVEGVLGSRVSFTAGGRPTVPMLLDIQKIKARDTQLNKLKAPSRQTTCCLCGKQLRSRELLRQHLRHVTCLQNKPMREHWLRSRHMYN